MATSDPWAGPRWELWGNADSSKFFTSLVEAFPGATTLFLEGSPAPDVDAFLRSAAQPGPYLPERNTIWPRQNLYRLPFDGPTLSSLGELADRHAEPEVLDHLHVYAGEVPLAYWHDAFDKASPLMVAPTADRDRVLGFAARLGMDPWQFPRPDQGIRDARTRFTLAVGLSLLVLWTAAVSGSSVLVWLEMMRAKQSGPTVGGAGIALGLFAGHALMCGVVLLAAWFAPTVRASRGLRWLVGSGLAMVLVVVVVLVLDLLA